MNRNNSNRRKPQRGSPPIKKTKLGIGKLVYFHAFADPADKTSYFFCKGYVVRTPHRDSPVYKIVVTAVDPRSVLCGENPVSAKRLLNKKIAREPGQVTDSPVAWYRKTYEDWLEVTEKELIKLKGVIKKKKADAK